MPEAISVTSATRRGLHRVVAGGLATAAVAPLRVDRRRAGRARHAGAARRASASGTAARCTASTPAGRRRTCKHRLHKPIHARPRAPDATRGPAAPSRPRSTPSCPSAAALHLASRFTYGMTPALHAEMQSFSSNAAWFAAQLQPAVDRGPGRRPVPVVVDLDRPGRPDDLAARPDQGRGHLGGDGQLPALVPAAAHLLQAPGARGRHRVLREPPARAGPGRRRLRLPVGLREADPLARPRPVRPDARRGDHPPRHGDQPRQRQLDQVRAQREPRPRAARAAHRGPRQPHRGRRQELGPDPDRLPRRHVAHLERLVRRRRATGPARSRSWASPTPTPPRTAARSPRPTSPTWRTTPATARRLARKLAVRFVSDSPSDALVQHLADVYLANQTAIVPVLQALVAHPEFAAAARRQGAHAHRRRRGHLPRPGRRRRAGRSTATRPPTRCSTRPRTSARRRSAGPDPTGSPRPAPPGRRPRGSSRPSRPTTSMCGGWWPKKDASYHPVTYWVPAHRLGSRCGSTRWSTTSRAASCAGPPARGSSTPAAWPPGSRRTHRRSPSTTRSCVGHARAPDHHPRQPGAHEPMTADDRPTSTDTCCDEFARDRAAPGWAGAASCRTAAVLGGAAAVTTVHGTAFTSTAYAAAARPTGCWWCSRCAAPATASAWSSRTATPSTTRPGPRSRCPSNRLLAKDGFFGLHPALAPLLPWWTSGKMAAVQATGLPVPEPLPLLRDGGGRGRRPGLRRSASAGSTGSSAATAPARPIEAIQFGGGVPSRRRVRPGAGPRHHRRRLGDPLRRRRPGRRRPGATSR